MVTVSTAAEQLDLEIGEIINGYAPYEPFLRHTLDMIRQGVDWSTAVWLQERLERNSWGKNLRDAAVHSAVLALVRARMFEASGRCPDGYLQDVRKLLDTIRQWSET